MHEDQWPISQIRGYQAKELEPTCICYMCMVLQP